MKSSFQQAFRALRRDLLFAGFAISILAIGIGANTTVFTLLNTILLKPLPYREPAQLVQLTESLPDIAAGGYPFSAPDVIELRKRNRSLRELAACANMEFDLSGKVDPMRLRGAKVEAQLWPMLGVAPVMGRVFDEAEERRDDKVAVLSYATWQGVFGGDPELIGKTLDLDRESYRIVAVMPRGFQYPPLAAKHAEIWVPLSFTQRQLADLGNNYYNRVVARRRDGVGDLKLQEDLKRVGAEIRATYPAAFPGKLLTIAATPLMEDAVGNTRGLLGLLAASVGCVLLIGCANIGSLMLAKAVARRDEFAVRKALGATGWHLLKASATEGLLVAIPGAALGLLLASWGIEILVRLAPESLPRLAEVSVDWRVALFAMAMSLVTTLLFSLAPAWQASRSDPGLVRTQSRGALRLGSGLVAVEVALCLVLLGVTGLLMQSYWNVLHVDPGFRPERLLSFEINSKSPKLYEQLDPLLAALPGVQSMSYADAAPLNLGWQQIFGMEGQTSIPANTPQMSFHGLVSAGHFENLGIRLLSGRGFGPGDREGQPLVCVINETFSKQFYPKGDAIGRALRFGGLDASFPLVRIVGVVADTKRSSLSEAPAPQTYQPMLQVPVPRRSYFLRTAIAPDRLAHSVRQVVHSVDRKQVVAEMHSMEERIDQKAAGRKFQMLLLSVFGVAALLLAVTGIFAVIANLVARQSKEIGLRMALGAGRAETLGMVLRRGFALVVVGIGIGVAGLWLCGKQMESFLYGVAPGNLWSVSGAIAVMLLAAIAAIALPALRAVRINPAVALRGD
ncbi:ABC transporter permease [Bryobacter aggregatus]|uniref:ABC transporter permease n=1 Tax=Bryobacter aggregatus TaxID=360054 RepID=UPI0004E1802B|nr:ABC transporter permease [Bryobacter aggregatus]